MNWLKSLAGLVLAVGLAAQVCVGPARAEVIWDDEQIHRQVIWCCSDSERYRPKVVGDRILAPTAWTSHWWGTVTVDEDADGWLWWVPD